MALSTTERGARAEKVARRRLAKLGYRILEKNHRNRAGEIDLVAIDGETLCFVEVKARSRNDFGGAVAAVSAAKQQRLRRAAEMYLALNPYSGPCRFDIVALDREGPMAWKVEVYQNAF